MQQIIPAKIQAHAVPDLVFLALNHNPSSKLDQKSIRTF